MMGNKSTRACPNMRTTMCSAAGNKMEKCSPTKGKQHLFDQEPVGIPESKPARFVSPAMSDHDDAVCRTGQHENMSGDFCGSSIFEPIVSEKPTSPKVTVRKEELLTSAAAAAVRCMVPHVSDDDLWTAFKTFCHDASDTTHPLLSQRLLDWLTRTDVGRAESDDKNNHDVLSRCPSSLCCQSADPAVSRPSTCSAAQDQRPVENTEEGKKSRGSENDRHTDSKCVVHHPEAAAAFEKGREPAGEGHDYFAQLSVEQETRLEDQSEPLTEVSPHPVTSASSASLLLTSSARKNDKPAAVSRYKTVLAENKRLKRRQLCRLCKTQAVNATLLPCGHFVYCLECAQTLQRCGICDKEILGDVRTFLS